MKMGIIAPMASKPRKITITRMNSQWNPSAQLFREELMLMIWRVRAMKPDIHQLCNFLFNGFKNDDFLIFSCALCLIEQRRDEARYIKERLNKIIGGLLEKYKIDGGYKIYVAITKLTAILTYVNIYCTRCNEGTDRCFCSFDDQTKETSSVITPYDIYQS